MKKQEFYKKILILLGISFLVIIFLPQTTEAQDLPLVWSVTSNPSSGDIAGNYDIAYSITTDDIYIYIAGKYYFYIDPDQYGNHWRVEKRRKSDGGLEWGMNETDFHGIENSIITDATYIYIAGRKISGGNESCLMQKRRKSDGGVEWERVFWMHHTVNHIGSGELCSITADDTYLYIAGSFQPLDTVRWRVQKRRKSDGGLEWSQIINYGGDSGATSITADNTYLYITGYDESSGPSDPYWHVEKRRKSDGGLEWGMRFNPSSGFDRPRSITVDDTYIYLAGEAAGQWYIEKRRKSDGGIEWTQTLISTGDDGAHSITADGSYLYIAGYDSSPGNAQWRIERRKKSDGAIVSTSTSNYSNGSDIAKSITTDGSYLYIAGYDSSPGNAQWRIERRSLSLYIDIGLRVFNGTKTVAIAAEPTGTLTSPLRIAKNGVIYGIALVNLGDPDDSGVRVWISSGIKALRKLFSY